MEYLFAAFVACVLIGLNVKATLLIAKDTLSTPPQKRWQMALV